MSRICHFLLLGLLLLAGGCVASPPIGQSAPVSRQLILTWSQDVPATQPALAAFEDEASRIAGVGVRRSAAISGSVIAIEIKCADEPQCDAGMQRLRADRRVISLVADQRSRRHHPAGPTSPSN